MLFYHVLRSESCHFLEKKQKQKKTPPKQNEKIHTHAPPHQVKIFQQQFLSYITVFSLNIIRVPGWRPKCRHFKSSVK